MTHIKLIARFWDTCKAKPLMMTDQVLYLFLVNESYTRKRLNPIELRTQYIMALIDMARADIIGSIGRLKRFGLIDAICNEKGDTVVVMLKDTEVTDTKLSDRHWPAPAPEAKQEPKAKTDSKPVDTPPVKTGARPIDSRTEYPFGDPTPKPKPISPANCYIST